MLKNRSKPPFDSTRHIKNICSSITNTIPEIGSHVRRELFVRSEKKDLEKEKWNWFYIQRWFGNSPDGYLEKRQGQECFFTWTQSVSKRLGNNVSFVWCQIQPGAPVRKTPAFWQDSPGIGLWLWSHNQISGWSSQNCLCGWRVGRKRMCFRRTVRRSW